MSIPTEITINSYPTAGLPACQEISPPPYGQLKRTDTGAGVEGMVITVMYNASPGHDPLIGTDKTNASGIFSIPPPVYILEVVDTFRLSAYFAGDAPLDLAPSSIWTTIKINYCDGDADLAAAFWISKWRVSIDIEADTYAGLLCIDPNGVRATNKGPVTYVLDDLNFSPGITEKSGIMRCQINDNANGTETHPEGRVDMELLKGGTIWIQDDDEFWVGVQRGPLPGGNEPHGAWDPSGGSDEEGAGRQWLMGGYISKRYYRYGRNGDITAVIIGKDYMDIWKDQIFGTPSLPRNYTEATDLARIAKDILDDVNAFQPLGWRYSAHPTYFPATAPLTLDCKYDPAPATACVVADNLPFTTGPAFIWDDESPGEVVTITGFTGSTQIDFVGSPIQQILGYWVANHAKIAQAIGIEWKKEFNQEAADTVMIDICDESSYEWRIDYGKRVMLYPRTSAPPAPSIRFSTNIRNLPEVVMGDTTERITHVIVTDATISSIPPDIDAWCLNPDTWPDLTNPNRGYSASSIPPPANPADSIYADSTLVYDDEVAPALCFQNESAPNFSLDLSIYRDASGEAQYSKLHLDLREWGKLKFRFRHATRTDFIGRVASNAPTSSIFKTDLLSAVEDYYKDMTLRFTRGTLTDEISIITAYAQATKQITVSPAFSEAPSVTDAFIIEPGTTYRLQLHTGGVDLAGGEFFNNRYQYDFGVGTQGVLDAINSNEWTEIELLLPEVDVNGVVTNLNGWTAHDAWDVIHGVDVPPNPTDINWISIDVACGEDDPGHGPGQALESKADPGDEYLEVAHPGYFASGSPSKLFLLPNTYILEDSGDSEEVRIRGVGLLSTPSPNNLELDKGVLHKYTVGAGARISVKGGWTICFSQLHFQRRLRYEPSADAPTPPYRYRMMVAKEMENLNEAVARADGILEQEEGTMRPVRVVIDGDPLYEVGYSPRLRLDVDPFDSVLMFIDDIQYELGPDLDLRITLTLGEGSRRVRELTEFSILDAHDKQLRNLGLGRSKTRVLR